MRSSLPPEALSVSLCSLVGLGVALGLGVGVGLSVALGLGVDVGLGVAAMLDEDGCFVVERRAVGSFVSTFSFHSLMLQPYSLLPAATTVPSDFNPKVNLGPAAIATISVHSLMLH